MSTAYDLFTYPQTPGWKARATSQAAAETMKPKAKRLQGLCLDALAQYGPLTADECAERLQERRDRAKPA